MLLELFFSNLLLGTNYELKNRYIHVDFVDKSTAQSINSEVLKCQFDTLNCTLEELAVLELIAKNPTMKQQELVEATGKSIATIKRNMKSLQDKTISAVKAARDMASGKFWFKSYCPAYIFSSSPYSLCTISAKFVNVCK